MRRFRIYTLRWAAVPVIAMMSAGAGSVLALGASTTTSVQQTTTNGTSTTSTSTTSTTSTGASTGTAATVAAAQQERLANIKSRGDAEIDRRLTQLSSLDGLVASASRITASDKSTLTTQVNNEISGLTTLKTHLDGDTTAASAATDVQDMFTEYRVYALITPKVHIIKAADDQQTTEADLTTLATNLQTRLTSAQQSGKDVTDLQAQLTAMSSEVKAAQGISAPLEAAVIGLQPSDYDSNHSVLSGDVTQLQTAHADNQSAYAAAKSIVKGLKQLTK